MSTPTTLPAGQRQRAAAPAWPIVPRPLWEAHRLFLEPQFPDGVATLEDDEDGDPDITP